MPLHRVILRPPLSSPALWLGAACLVVHLFANANYDVFRDEMYFIVCGEHFAFGYVDQPPLIPWIAAASHAVFGDALTPLRLAPALAMSATVALAAELTRRLGGGRYAQTLAGLATLLSPVLLVDGLLLSTDMLQPLTWLGCAWALARLVETRDERWWLAFGAFVGVSLLSKYLIGFYLVGLALGVLATPLRRSLARPWIYAGAALAMLMASPSLIWQGEHGWPFLELGGAAIGGKNVALSPLGFLAQQALNVGPILAPLWIAGLWRLARNPDLRAIPIAYVAMTLLFLISHGKAYYLAPIYPTLFAAGAVAFEKWIANRLARGVVAGVFVVASVIIAPLVLPVLTPETYVRYARALRAAPAPMERGAQSVLPQYFADMFGWREMAEEVARVYRALPDDERADAVFFGRNYGEAAALDIYGPQFAGPPTISAHNNYFLWGTRGASGKAVIMLGGERSKIRANYANAEVAGHIASRYAMPYETDIDVYVLRAPKRPLDEIWAELKHYD